MRARVSAPISCRGSPRAWPWAWSWPSARSPGRCRSPCWWWPSRCCSSWEWGRLVHGRDADLVIAVHVAAAGVAAVLAAVGFVGLGLLALPIGAILAMLLSLGRNSLFSALGVFYAGLPAVALIWLRSDADARAARRRLPDRASSSPPTRRVFSAAGCWAGRSCGRAFRPTRRGPGSSARWWPAPWSARCSGSRFRTARRCGWRRPVPCCHSWPRPAISPSRPSSAGSAPRIPAR